MADWKMNEKGEISLVPLVSFASVLVQPGALALKLGYVSSQEELDLVKARQAPPSAIQIRLEPAQARDLAERLLQSVEALEAALAKPDGPAN